MLARTPLYQEWWCGIHGEGSRNIEAHQLSVWWKDSADVAEPSPLRGNTVSAKRSAQDGGQRRAEEFQVTVSRCRVQDLLVLLKETDRGLDQAAEGSLDPLMLVLQAFDLVMGLRQQVYLFSMLNSVLCCTHGFLRFLAKQIN
jgi:hypothetical protein